MTDFFIVLIISFIVALLGTFCSYQLIQHYQLCAYHIGEYFKNIKKFLILRLLVISGIVFASTLVVSNILDLLGGHYGLLGLGIFVVLIAIFTVMQYKKKYKTPLKFTPRIIRFMIMFLLVTLSIWIGVVYAFYNYVPIIGYSIIGLMPIFNYLLCGIIAVLVYPLESLLQSKFIYLAKKKLVEMPELKIIGITGSYGKTSVKFILQKLLEGTYKVCASPNSFNTPMGLCRSINQNLKSSDQIFIAEMGARKKGDITRLCNIARPDISIITAVGKQHLATFKNIENVAQAKYEIVQESNTEGLAVFNGDSEYAVKLFETTTKEKILTGAQSQAHEMFAYYSNAQTFNRGSRFVLNIDGKAVDCVTTLLGIHNISNITLAAAVAYKLGVSIELISERITELKAVPHRLQLIEAGGGMTIIDDSFNANIEGAKIALEVLASFLQKKVVITAGLVDMGKHQKSVNFELGKLIANAADWCIITGPNSLYIYDGLVDQNFNIKNVRICDNLNQAMKVLGTISGSKVVLFQNDLPDNY
ncbi:MAG TPA: UDP-N-acetylmuramoyl-tripeptide--D-alanyl-D-alanine ligase [Clostridia bacterium]